MKNFILLFFLLLLFCNLKAQTKVNFITDYYPFTNKAEIYITKGKFENALEMYQKAFKNNTIGFRQDYENALYCALKIDKINIALEYAKQMAIKGFQLEYFKKDEHFKKLTTSNKWIDFEKSYNKYYLKNSNKFLIDTLTKIKKADQKYRNEYAKYYNEIRKIDSTNILSLISIFKKYGYPNEEMIGNQHLFSVVLRHHYKSNDLSKRSFLDSLLLEAIKDGKVYNESVISGLTIQIEKPIWDKYKHNERNLIYKIDTCVYKLNYDDNEIKNVDKNRKEIGLCSTAELEQKLMFYYSPILYKSTPNFMEAVAEISKTQPFYFWVHHYMFGMPKLSQSDRPSAMNQKWLDEQIETKKMIPIPNPNKK